MLTYFTSFTRMISFVHALKIFPICLMKFMYLLIVGTVVQEVLEEVTQVTSNVGNCFLQLVRINLYWQTNFQ